MKRLLLPFALVFIFENSFSYPQKGDSGDTVSVVSSVLFMPGIVSTGLNEFGSAFNPGQNELFYCIRHRSDLFIILKTCFSENSWSTPEVAEFSGIYNDADAFITHDGRHLFFCSDRPVNDHDTIRDWNIWRLEKIDGRWLNPKLLEFNTPDKNEMYPTVSKKGNVYFHSDLLSSAKTLDFNRTDLFCSSNINGKFSGYEKLPICSDEFPEWDPFISPDEDFLIFTTTIPGGLGGGDMYISFRSEDGKWSKPLNMGAEVNSNGMDYCPNLTPDKKHLMFSSYRNNLDFSRTPLTFGKVKEIINSPQNGNGDIYIINSNIIDNLK